MGPAENLFPDFNNFEWLLEKIENRNFLFLNTSPLFETLQENGKGKSFIVFQRMLSDIAGKIFRTRDIYALLMKHS